jgi:hypothetical protein
VIPPIQLPSPNTFRLQRKRNYVAPPVNTAHTFVNREMIIQALNNSNTILIPFIVEPFGGLGPIANRFLFSL